MAGVNNRNPPFSPFSVNSVTEIRRPPYRGGLGSVIPGCTAMIDLFGLQQQPKRIHDKPEAAALVEVLKALNTHPAVAWCERMNSGAARMGARFVRFGFKGCPDVLGQLRDGRLLGVEVKAKTGRLRPEQAIFLERIRGASGVAFVARDLRDVMREMEKHFQLDKAKEVQA